MKVPTLSLYSYYVAIYGNGEERLLPDTIIRGCYEMTQHLEKMFGIKTSTSTVYNCKKLHTPMFFRYSKTKDELLAYLNWALNFPKEQRVQFFDNELDKSKFYDNNPIVDVKIKISKQLLG